MSRRKNMCPVCTVATIAGLEISRYLGIDDVITSIWIGGLILSSSFWLISWLKSKWPKLHADKYYIHSALFVYLIVLVPLKLNGSIGIYGNSLWGIDKILLGVIVGSIAFLIGIWADKYERKVRTRILFPFQKVVFPIVGLIISSLVFYFLTK